MMKTTELINFIILKKILNNDDRYKNKIKINIKNYKF